VVQDEDGWLPLGPELVHGADPEAVLTGPEEPDPAVALERLPAGVVGVDS
jgi:hypothetical protein